MIPFWVFSVLITYSHSESILINEIMTKVTSKSQYLEIARNSAETELNLDGHSILIAKTSTDRNNKRLQVSVAIDLSGHTMQIGQRFLVVGRHESETEANDIIPFIPTSPALQLVNKQLNAYNWLEIEPKRYMVIFLVHSPDKKIFEDQTIWPFKMGHHRMTNMGDELQHYLLSNFLDIFFVRGTSVPPVCKELNRFFVPEHLDEVHSIVTTGSSLDDLSISRCGLEFKKCLFRSYKSSAKTPGNS